MIISKLFVYFWAVQHLQSCIYLFNFIFWGGLQHCENFIILYLIHFNSSSGCSVTVHRKKKPINVIALKRKAFCVTVHFLPVRSKCKFTDTVSPLDGSDLILSTYSLSCRFSPWNGATGQMWSTEDPSWNKIQLKFILVELTITVNTKRLHSLKKMWLSHNCASSF